MKKHNVSNSVERKVGVILSYAQMAVSSLGGLLYTPIMLHIVGKNEYGLYGTVSSFVGLLSLLNLGFSSSYIKFYSSYKAKNQIEKIYKFNALFFTVFAVIAAIALAIGGFFSFHLDWIFDKGLTNDEYSKARIMMIMLTASTAIGFLTTVFNCNISANERFIYSKAFSLATTIINYVLNIIVLKCGYGVVGLIAVALFFSTFCQLINILYCYKKLNFKFDFTNLDKSVFKQVLTFSGLIALNMIVDKINVGIDSILLGRFCGTVVVASYSVAAALNSYYANFSVAISGIFTPHVHKLVNSYDMDSKEQRTALTEFFVRVGRVQFLLMALIASGVVFFGREFIFFWAGEGYEDAYYIALILILPSIIPLTQNVGIEIQRAENRHHYRSYIYIVMAIANLVMSYFLCQIWGGIGSAIGTGVSCILSTIIIMNIVYDKKINIDIKQYWKNIARQTLGMIVPFAVGFLIMKFVNIDSIIKLILWIVVYTIVYCIFVWFLSANAYERNLIISIVKKVVKK